jgi:hypothetical protein
MGKIVATMIVMFLGVQSSTALPPSPSYPASADYSISNGKFNDRISLDSFPKFGEYLFALCLSYSQAPSRNDGVKKSISVNYSVPSVTFNYTTPKSDSRVTLSGKNDYHNIKSITLSKPSGNSQDVTLNVVYFCMDKTGETTYTTIDQSGSITKSGSEDGASLDRIIAALCKVVSNQGQLYDNNSLPIDFTMKSNSFKIFTYENYPTYFPPPQE